MFDSTAFKTVFAASGAAISYFYGGWSALLQVLLAFVIIDYVTGVLASAMEGKLSSAIGAKGIAKKVLLFVIAAMPVLSLINPEQIGVKQLAFGELAENFHTCRGYRINPGTGEVEFAF